MRTLTALLALTASLALPAHAGEVRYYAVPSASGPHDVAPAPDGTVWYTAQRSGELWRLHPRTGRTEHVPLGVPARRRTALSSGPTAPPG
jgi:virginiamycin B lyase